MTNIRQRLAKVEAQTQSREEWVNDRKAKLREIDRRNDEGNPIIAYMLERELETGRKYTLAMAMVELAESSEADGETTA